MNIEQSKIIEEKKLLSFNCIENLKDFLNLNTSVNDKKITFQVLKNRTLGHSF